MGRLRAHDFRDMTDRSQAHVSFTWSRSRSLGPLRVCLGFDPLYSSNNPSCFPIHHPPALSVNMSEGNLSNRYRAYKAGTQKVVDFLAQTARKARDVTQILPSLKAANTAAKQAQSNKRATPPDSTIHITTNQLLSLAQVIVDAALPIPDEILRTIRTVIEGREHCAELYKSMHGQSSLSDGTHQHFIKVLKDIFRLLEKSKAASTSTKSSDAANATTLSTESLGNMFELLEIDEPSSTALGSAPSKGAKPVSFKLEPIRDEKSFTIWCLLEDLLDLRRELKALWLDYKAGKNTLPTASRLTSVAIHLAQNLEREFIDENPSFKSYPAVLEHLGLIILAYGDEVFVCPYVQDEKKPPPSHHDQINADQITHLICPRAWLVLMGFIETLSRSIGKFHRPQDPTVSADAFIQAHPFGKVLKSLMPEFEMVSRMAPGSRDTGDHVLFTLHALADHSSFPPPIWAVVALQIHMDIYDIIGRETDYEVFMFRGSVAADLQRFQTLRQIIDKKLASSGRDFLLKDCIELTDDIVRLSKDPYRSINKDARVITQFSTESAFKIYKAFPAIAGKIINTTALLTHSRGLTCCDLGEIALSAAYLYRTALRAGVIKHPWPDMDFFIERQSRSRPFVLESDIGVTSMAKNFGIALGLKSQAFRRQQRPDLPKPAFVKQNSRRVDLDWPLIRVVNPKPSADKIVSKNDHLEVVQNALTCLDKLVKSNCVSERLAGICQKYRKTGKVSSAHLLYALKEALIADEKHLSFDYIGFYDTCMKLHEEVHSKCNPLGLFSKGNTQVQCRVYESVYAILWDAADRSTSSKPLHGSMLARAAGVIADVVEHKGDQYTKLAGQKVQKMLRPVAGRTRIEKQTRGETNSAEEELLKRFFGISTTESRGAGMFCSCKEEVDARISMQRMRTKPGLSAAINELFDAGCKVMAYTLAGVPERERADITDRLAKAIPVAMPGMIDEMDAKDMLEHWLEKGVRAAAKGNKDAPDEIKVIF